MVDFKGSMLLEADPSSNYEKGVLEFAQAMASSGRPVFAYTSKGSPVHLQLKQVPGVKFFVLSESSYPKKSAADSLEIMVPRNDQAVLLSTMDDALSQSPKKAIAIIFDNISSLILDGGFQECYKFLRQVNEILSHGDVTGLFLILSKAQDDKMMNIVKNLYSAHLVYNGSGLRSTK